VERLLYSKREAASALGVSIRTLETLVSLNQLRSVRIGRRRMVSRRALEAFVRRDHPTIRESGDARASKAPAVATHTQAAV
jgi:excisionase family DNA binding protein